MVPTCEREAELAACLEALAPRRLQPVPGGCEVIVTDDGAGGAEGQRAERFPAVRFVRGPRRGPAANRNHGASLATGEWLAFVDDDCLPSPGWLAGFAAMAARRPEAQVLEGRTLATGTRIAADMEAPVNADGGFLWSCNFAIRRELFASLQGFDEQFPGPVMEDVELRQRLRERGIESVFVPDALVHHPWRRRKGRAFLRQYAASVDHYLTRHPGQAGFFTIRRSLRNLAGSLARLGREAIRQRRMRGLPRHAGLEIYRCLLLTAGALRRRRARSQALASPR
ncbi:MAG TPA: glycosyltransferase [Opitutus sp.]|nr:glycosyltransferase [Opitutus sp.]